MPPVTDPAIIEEFRRRKAERQQPQAAPTAAGTPIGPPVTDPAIIERFRNRKRFNEAAKQKREQILQTGENMAPAPDRISQAFEVAADPIADQSLRPDYDPYDFTEHTMRSLPFGDEVGSGGAALGRYLAGKTGLDSEVDLGDQYQRQRALDRAEQERYARQNPGKSLGGQLLGVAAGGAPRGAARALGVRAAPAAIQVSATLGGRVAEGVRGGAGLGALYGAGEGEGVRERAVNAVTGAGIGAGVGAALPLAGAAARAGRRLRSGYDPAIGGHVQRLEQEADNFYTQMDQAGVQLSRPALNRILTNIQVRAHNAGIDRDLHRGPSAVIRALQRDMQDLSRAPTLRRMDQIRRKIRDAPAESADDRRILRIMREGLDENLNRLRPRDLVGGNARVGMAALREGRRLQRQFYKAETVDNLVENARDALGANYTQAGLQTGIRQQFRALNKKIRNNAQERGRWSNEERRLINRIVRGGSGENVGRWLGMLALRGRSGAGTYAGAVGAGIMGGLDPVTATAIASTSAAAGEAAKRISTARGVMRTEALDRLIGTGSAVAPQRQLGPGSQRLGNLRRLVTSGASGLGARLLTGE